MTTEFVLATQRLPAAFAGRTFPSVIFQAGPDATRRFVEFFTANFRNPNTRAAYPTGGERDRTRLGEVGTRQKTPGFAG